MPAAMSTSLPSSTIRIAGIRRLSLTMQARLDQADRFCGLPKGTPKPLRLLAAFQEAEPYLGLPVHAFKLVSWLVKLSQPQDWEEGSRPIVWPSARRQQEFLGLSPAGVKNLNRVLFEAGIFVIRDNGQGKRYGRRGPDGRIIEAYGFDLSPLALRHQEFLRLAVMAQVERQRMRELRRRTTMADRAIRQAVAELAAQGQDGDELRQFAQEAAELVKTARKTRRSEDLGPLVEALETRKSEVLQRLREMIQAVEISPEGLVSKPLIDTATTSEVNLEKDTVAVRRGCNPVQPHPPKPDTPVLAAGVFDPHPIPPPESLKPGTLIELAPRLERYLDPREFTPGWREIIGAAEWLAGELGVSPTLWRHACQVMGPVRAAIALAFVTTRPAAHFTSSPAGYFAGMVRKDERGELHLEGTLWKLRQQKWGKAERKRTH